MVRARVAVNPLSVDRTLVIKALPQQEDLRAFQRELASYKYVTALPNAARPGPQLIASDFDDRLLVLSDLGSGRSMSDLLRTGDATEIARGTSAWGQALGRMHAATVGGESDFQALLRRSSTESSGDLLAEHAVRAADRFESVTALLGAPAPAAIGQRLHAACELFAEGEHRAFSPSDVGPENILINDGLRFMDYEWGGFRDATLDITYAVVTAAAGMALAETDIRTRIEIDMVDAWRAEVKGMWPSLAGDRDLAGKLLTARLLWCWLSTCWLLPGEPAVGGLLATDSGDVTGGHEWALHTSDARVIVSRWADLAAAADRADDTDLAEFADATGTALRQFWFS